MSSLDSLKKTIISPREKLMMELSQKKGQLLALFQGANNAFTTPLFTQINSVKSICDNIASTASGKFLEVADTIKAVSEDPLECLPDMKHEVTSIVDARLPKKVYTLTSLQMKTAIADVKRMVEEAKADAVGVINKSQIEDIKKRVLSKYPEELLALVPLSMTSDLSRSVSEVMGYVRGLGDMSEIKDKIAVVKNLYEGFTPDRLKDKALSALYSALDKAISVLGALLLNYRSNLSYEKKEALKSLENSEKELPSHLEERVSGSALLKWVLDNANKEEVKEESIAGNVNQITRIEGICLCETPDEATSSKGNPFNDPKRYDGVLVEILQEVDECKWGGANGILVDVVGGAKYLSPIENPIDDVAEKNELVAKIGIQEWRLRCYKGGDTATHTITDTLQNEIEGIRDTFSEVQDAKQAILAFAIPMVYPNIALGVRTLVMNKIKLAILKKRGNTPTAIIEQAIKAKEHKKKGYDRKHFDRIKKLNIEKRIEASEGNENVINQAKDDAMRIMNEHYNLVVSEYHRLRKMRVKSEDFRIMADMNKYVYIPMLERVNKEEGGQRIYNSDSKTFNRLRSILENIIATRSSKRTSGKDIIDKFNNEDAFKKIFVKGLSESDRQKWLEEVTKRRTGKDKVSRSEYKDWKHNEERMNEADYDPYTLFETLYDESVDDDGRELNDKELLSAFEKLVTKMGLKMSSNFIYSLENDLFPLFKVYREKYLEAFKRLIQNEADKLNKFFDDCIAIVHNSDKRIEDAMNRLSRYSLVKEMPAPLELYIDGKIYAVYQIGKESIDIPKITSPFVPSDALPLPTKSNPTFLDRAYWVRHFALDTLFNVTPDRWVTWIILPAFTLKLPVIYIAIVPVKIGPLLLVFGIGIAGLGTNLCLLVINTSNKDLSYLAPLTIALNKAYDAIKSKVEDVSNKATSGLSGLVNKADEEVYKSKRKVAELTDELRGLDGKLSSAMSDIKDTIGKLNVSYMASDGLSKCERFLGNE